MAITKGIYEISKTNHTLLWVVCCYNMGKIKKNSDHFIMANNLPYIRWDGHHFTLEMDMQG